MLALLFLLFRIEAQSTNILISLFSQCTTLSFPMICRTLSQSVSSVHTFVALDDRQIASWLSGWCRRLQEVVHAAAVAAPSQLLKPAAAEALACSRVQPAASRCAWLTPCVGAPSAKLFCYNLLNRIVSSHISVINRCLERRPRPGVCAAAAVRLWLRSPHARPRRHKTDDFSSLITTVGVAGLRYVERRCASSRQPPAHHPLY